MTGQTTGRAFRFPRLSYGQAAAWPGFLLLVLIPTANLLAPAARTGMLIGIGAGAISSVAGIGLVRVAQGRPLQVALAARMAGFALRIVLLGLSLAALRAEPFGFVFGFFPLFFLSTVLEQLIAADAPARGTT